MLPVVLEAGRGELAADFNTCFWEFQSYFLFLESSFPEYKVKNSIDRRES